MPLAFARTQIFPVLLAQAAQWTDCILLLNILRPALTPGPAPVFLIQLNILLWAAAEAEEQVAEAEAEPAVSTPLSLLPQANLK
jgi:hypothetical protein